MKRKPTFWYIPPERSDGKCIAWSIAAGILLRDELIVKRPPSHATFWRKKEQCRQLKDTMKHICEHSAIDLTLSLLAQVHEWQNYLSTDPYRLQLLVYNLDDNALLFKGDQSFICQIMLGVYKDHCGLISKDSFFNAKSKCAICFEISSRNCKNCSKKLCRQCWTRHGDETKLITCSICQLTFSNEQCIEAHRASACVAKKRY